MKLGKTVLLEIVDIVREGLLTGNDISQGLRDIDVVVETKTEDLVELSGDYVKSHPRATDWSEDE